MMRHTRDLKAMRHDGLRPGGWVYLECQFDTPEWLKWASTDPGNPRIVIEATDPIERLDLRFLTRCRVSIDGGNEARVRALFAACQDHGAERVLAHIHRPNAHGGFDLIHILDTAHVMTWSMETASV